ncbi:MAG TPA: hypothetical protein VEZ47_01905, partial [Gemmatirosa sp.]|nr:hypothetical protein [Gemmatirosa sp.]
DAAFAGVWGESPAALYGRFTARVTAAAFAERARLEAAGLVEGAPYQRLARGTGDPAVSRDGRRIAVTLAGTAGEPSRVVLWRAGADTPADTAADSAYARAVRRLRRRDPEDVPAVRVRPSPKTAVATLQAVGGRGHHDPRFLADGRVLVWRDEPTAAGVLRPDLFLWDAAGGSLRRVTHGGNVRQADPAPDGRSAAAVRCDAGTCHLMRVELATGAVSLLRAGTPDTVWTRPRWSPDGRRLVAGVQAGGRWRVVVLDPSAPGAAPRPVGPTDDAERYDATFTPDGRAVVYVSEAGGIPNLARATLDAPAAETPLTRVTSAAFAPVASGADGSWLFLHLTPRGLDVRRLHPDSTPVRGATVAVLTAPSLLPRGEAALTSAIAQRPPVTVPRFAVGTVTEEPYGVGPRHHAVLPFGDAAPGGGSYGLQFGSLDPAGRLTWLAQGAGAVRRGWSGGSLRAAWRGLPVTVVGEGFALAQDLGASPGAAGGPVPVAVRDDARWAGGSFIAEGVRWRAAGGGATRGPAALPGALDARLTARAGASAGHLTLAPSGAASAPDLPDARERRRGTRALGFAELGARLAGAQGTRTLALSLDAHGSTGRTHDAGWRRGVARAHVAGGASRFGIALDGLLGATSAGAPAWEQFALGGNDPGLVDDAVLSQRIALPALPAATQVGPRVAVARAALTTRGLEPYVAWAQAGDDFRGRWQRVLGVESHVATPFVPFARAPRARLTLGVGYSLDEPIRERVRGYFRVAYLP